MLGIRRLTYHFDVHKSLFCPTNYIVQGLSKVFIVPIVRVYCKGREARSIRQQAKLNGKVHEILRDRNAYYFMLQPNIYLNNFFKYLTDEREAKEM